MSPQDSFADVMERLRRGEGAAAQQLFNRFAARLVALARQRLDNQLRQKVDPEDILQSVCKSFFLRYAGGEFELANWDNLWTLLTLLTVRKCANLAKRYHTDRRDVRREAAREAKAEESAPGWEAMDREPRPEEAAMLAEIVERLLQELDPRDREILVLSLQGYSHEEISRQVGYAERTVRRVLAQVRKRLERED